MIAVNRFSGWSVARHSERKQPKHLSVEHITDDVITGWNISENCMLVSGQDDECNYYFTENTSSPVSCVPDNV